MSRRLLCIQYSGFKYSNVARWSSLVFATIGAKRKLSPNRVLLEFYYLRRIFVPIEEILSVPAQLKLLITSAQGCFSDSIQKSNRVCVFIAEDNNPLGISDHFHFEMTSLELLEKSLLEASVTTTFSIL